MTSGVDNPGPGKPLNPPSRDVITEDVRRALAEDIGSGDVTSTLISPSAKASAAIICREPGVLCGRPWVDEVFAQVDSGIELAWCIGEGDALETNDRVCTLQGPARGLLTGERTALNFLQLLSGTATFARECARAVAGSRTTILDTRKTLPGLRLAQKYAVRCGGASNHRIGLFDAYLIKENHIVAAGSVGAAVKAAREMHPELKLEVEVESLKQLDEALEAGADIVMLDNFDLDGIRAAVERTGRRAKLEVSGNVGVSGLTALAETGVDYVSLGAITKNVRAIDFSMRFSPAESTNR